MAKDPAFLFYPSDFLTGTMFMTDEQTGKYIRLLCAQHQHGHLTENHMISICKSKDPIIWEKFERLPDGKYHNKRLHDEILRRQEYCNSRSHKGLAGRKPLNHKKTIRKSYGNRIEDRNRNEDGVESKIEDRIEKFRQQVMAYTKYSKEMLEAFFEYWSEKNRAGTKMLCEMKETWELERRLATWAKNDKVKTFKPRFGRQEVSRDQIKENALKTLEILEANKND